MLVCAVRYRLNSPGPLTYLVETGGRFFIYARGRLGPALPAPLVDALVAGRGGPWVPATGDLVVRLGSSPSAAHRPDATEASLYGRGEAPLHA